MKVRLIVRKSIADADGRCVCPVCKYEYRDHPTIVGGECLHLLCTGRAAKL